MGNDSKGERNAFVCSCSTIIVVCTTVVSSTMIAMIMMLHSSNTMIPAASCKVEAFRQGQSHSSQTGASRSRWRCAEAAEKVCHVYRDKAKRRLLGFLVQLYVDGVLSRVI